jgi:hypothetical protein
MMGSLRPQSSERKSKWVVIRRQLLQVRKILLRNLAGLAAITIVSFERRGFIVSFGNYHVQRNRFSVKINSFAIFFPRNWD